MAIVAGVLWICSGRFSVTCITSSDDYRKAAATKNIRVLALLHLPLPKIPILWEFLISLFGQMTFFRGKGFDFSVAGLEVHFGIDFQVHAAADGVHEVVSHRDADEESSFELDDRMGIAAGRLNPLSAMRRSD